MLFAKHFRQKDVMILSETVNRQYTTLTMFLKHGCKKKLHLIGQSIF